MSGSSRSRTRQYLLSLSNKAAWPFTGWSPCGLLRHPMTRKAPEHTPDRSQLSMRFRSASTQKSLPRELSTTRATGRMRPVVKRTSRSVPSKDARSILGARSCMLVKYRYLGETTGRGDRQVTGRTGSSCHHPSSCPQPVPKCMKVPKQSLALQASGQIGLASQGWPQRMRSQSYSREGDQCSPKIHVGSRASECELNCK